MAANTGFSRVAMAMAVIGVVVTALLAPSTAQARPGDRASSRDVPVAAGLSGKKALELVGRLGASRTGGVYLDRRQNRLVVAVTDEAAAEEVRDAGALPKIVKYDTAYLEKIKEKLDVVINTPGTSWGVDEPENQVIVRADTTVSTADYSTLEALIEPYGDAARIERLAGELRPSASINGGDYVVAYGIISCSLGFNVRKKADPNDKYFLTAGHCTKPTHYEGGRDWHKSDGTYIGYTKGAFYPENDFGLVRHYNASVTKYGNVETSGGVQDITHSRDSYVYEYVCSTGYKSGYSCGLLKQKNQTANYGDGKVYGLDIADICRIPGDSGGPLFRGDAALGLTSGYVKGTCMSYFQPVNEALAWYGMEVY
ncbi:S1 family peptidase [Streptomyces sp. HNM0663]|uniref:S1 family peptidase n=1 Tax=Streptomyces chengmaiensis TaxID=3040919 RepID=A0ABT6HNA7_9ACTN|nr:S1 family peptidase [Streptomyces chengmaiensis]MDH2389800.1 S1 family peptidase [Streptomyces chengmaiensis]